jgi:hypothetical protein
MVFRVIDVDTVIRELYTELIGHPPLPRCERSFTILLLASRLQ